MLILIFLQSSWMCQTALSSSISLREALELRRYYEMSDSIIKLTLGQYDEGL